MTEGDAGKPSAAGRVCTVTTLWDSLDNVRQFVARNLAAGADHMFIFLDAPAPDVGEYLEGLDAVTVVRTGKRYWRGHRPDDLNVRQIVNANTASYLLSPFDSVRWLFHIDGDEVLDIDRDELLSSDAPVARLSVLESVSRAHWDGPVDRFKRTPTPEELVRLTRLGVIPRPHLHEYFHGHIRGKVGMRPTLDLRLSIHNVFTRAGERVVAQPSPEWHVLHYDCWSSEEFLRKWASPMASRKAKFAGRRGRLRDAVNAVLDTPSLADEERDRRLMDIYNTYIADDVTALEEAGLLVAPRSDLHTPRGLGPDREAVHRLLDHLVSVERRYFMSPRRKAHPRELFEELLRSGSLDADLQSRLAATLARPPATVATVADSDGAERRNGGTDRS
ncbi:glycosyltransferase family 2 protein [Nocardioides bizhenqiangii]|uniref:Glycosyltransferase family 2 protein n=1 Tax=Nocardioides bizhenqiangii TaxID=3095076 RepID=A0ABZ0ZQ74_9ACTN|nr:MULTISPECIES: glycosyltransferase family 2 protein [unclassified Nocardioides]MDZ5619488.1 glycosyltransferase family 2 protein [Nocardioides sp. HM23]WQQ26495.1 glycosyltransferase family 2 protein [Nocardioides sp. HM61]